jgi:hypothetical protein
MFHVKKNNLFSHRNGANWCIYEAHTKHRNTKQLSHTIRIATIQRVYTKEYIIKVHDPAENRFKKHEVGKT